MGFATIKMKCVELRPKLDHLQYLCILEGKMGGKRGVVVMQTHSLSPPLFHGGAKLRERRKDEEESRRMD